MLLLLQCEYIWWFFVFLKIVRAKSSLGHTHIVINRIISNGQIVWNLRVVRTCAVNAAQSKAHQYCLDISSNTTVPLYNHYVTLRKNSVDIEKQIKVATELILGSSTYSLHGC